MRRTEQVQGLRLMKFEEVYGRTHRGGLSQAEAAEVLGVSERTFRRWRDRYEAEGADGLYDRRLGRLSARRAPVDEVARVLELFDTRYWDFTAKHFHEKLVADHGFKRSYNWLRLSLQAHGRRRAAPRRGAHRRKRPRRALPGMMLHQDGSSHEWVPRSMVGPDRHHGRCDQRYLLGLLRRRRGHHVELPGGVRGDPGQGPVLLALRRPRQPLLEHDKQARQTEAEGDMGFAGAAIAKCDDVFTTLDVFTTRQFQNHHLVERWHGFEVEADPLPGRACAACLRGEAFDGGELGHPDPPLDHAAFLINQLQFGQANKVTHMIDALGSALAGLLVVFP